MNENDSLVAGRFFTWTEAITLARIILNLITFNIFTIMLSQCGRKKSAKIDHISFSTMKDGRTDETQSTKESLSEKKEEDSFAKKRPIKRLARRSFEIRLKAPVDKEREDYKTFTAIKLPMSDLGDSDLEK